jgi:hypothetical protein
VARLAQGDENDAAVGQAVAEARGRKEDKAGNGVGDRDLVVLASGNLGPAGSVPANCGGPPATDRWVRARRRHHGQQLL